MYALDLHALHLVLIQNPEGSPGEMDELLTQQFSHLRNCLVDECPLVRTVAVEGCCGLLNLYWEIIPAATTALFVSRLTGVTCQGLGLLLYLPCQLLVQGSARHL